MRTYPEFYMIVSLTVFACIPKVCAVLQHPALESKLNYHKSDDYWTRHPPGSYSKGSSSMRGRVTLAQHISSLISLYCLYEHRNVWGVSPFTSCFPLRNQRTEQTNRQQSHTMTTKSLEWIPSWETNNSQVTQKNPSYLGYLNVRYCWYRNLPLDRNLRHITPFHA